ncbi:hypothetical protein TOK_5899 [Pseudonocardia sp. N23]|nr:hypothetical protein TOK_5899 [Pseudonocardia sp. N23]
MAICDGPGTVPRHLDLTVIIVTIGDLPERSSGRAAQTPPP